MGSRARGPLLHTGRAGRYFLEADASAERVVLLPSAALLAVPALRERLAALGWSQEIASARSTVHDGELNVVFELREEALPLVVQVIEPALSLVLAHSGSLLADYARPPLPEQRAVTAPPAAARLHPALWALAGAGAMALAFGVFVGLSRDLLLGRAQPRDDAGAAPTPAPAVPDADTAQTSDLPTTTPSTSTSRSAPKRLAGGPSPPAPAGSVGPGGACSSSADCAQLSYCTAGVCKCDTNNPLICNGVCFDSLSSDTCGSCTTRCAADDHCTPDGCRSCVSPEARCGAPHTCTNLDDDDDNCGSCGHKCDGAQQCSGGRCWPKRHVGDRCTDSHECADDWATCVAWTCHCPFGKGLVKGKCRSCPEGQTLEGDRCVPKS